MISYKYDSATNSFYPYSLKEQYEAAGSWPESGVDVDDSVYAEFYVAPPGKMRVAGPDGFLHGLTSLHRQTLNYAKRLLQL